MLKVIGSNLCKDTMAALEKLKNGNFEYEFYDISSSLDHLKKYLELRENEELYVQVKIEKRLGIPCFILDDGQVTFDIDKVAVK